MRYGVRYTPVAHSVAHTMDGIGFPVMGGVVPTPPMFSNILSYLKKPSTYVILVVGILIAFAYSRFVPGVVKSAAAKLPGAQ